MGRLRRAAVALLLGTVFLPLVMKEHQSCGTVLLERGGEAAPAIWAVATAFAEGEEWAIEAVETWEAEGRPGEMRE